MSASIEWNFLENWGRSLNLSDYPEWGESGIGSTANISNDPIMGKNTLRITSDTTQTISYTRSLSYGKSASPSQVTFSCRAYIPFGGTGQTFIRLLDNTQAVMGGITIDAASLILKISDSTGVKFTTISPVTSFSVPIFIEINLTPSSTNGTMGVKVNEQIIGSELVGLNTDPNNTGVIQYVEIGSPASAEIGVTDIGAIDPSISGNPQFYGDNDVQYLPVTANGATTNFTPNGLAANWQNVANIPPNTSDFNSSTTTGATDQFVVGTLSVMTESIGGIYVVASAENISGGLHTYSRQWSGSGGSTFANGAASVMTNGYLVYGDSPTVDPNTSAAWDVAGVNGMKIGYTLET